MTDIVPAHTTTTDEINGSVKLVWLALHADAELPSQKLLSVPRLADRIGLAPHTVRKALVKLRSINWFTLPVAGGKITFAHFPGPTVAIPPKLIFSKHLSVQTRVMYGTLQAVPGYRKRKGRFGYTALSRLTHLNVKTVRRAVQELVEEGWLRIKRVNQRSPIDFCLSEPVLTKTLAAQKRLDTAKHYGETLMKEYLSLIVDSEQFEDNARPGFLVNSTTQERLELDRFYYSHGVGWEFQGSQHYGATSFCTARESAKQQVRDRIKAETCQEKHIALVEIHAEDLTLTTMQKKVGNLLPQRDLQEYGKLIRLLANASQRYRNNLGQEKTGAQKAASR